MKSSTHARQALPAPMKGRTNLEEVAMHLYDNKTAGAVISVLGMQPASPGNKFYQAAINPTAHLAR
jgi:hypothetical protein